MTDNQPTVLFVCGGNTCRSPMAEALAKHLWRDGIHAESAGVEAGQGTMARFAIETILNLTGLDLAERKSRHIDEVNLGAFDTVVALDKATARELERRHASRVNHLLVWDVPDPFESGPERYGAVALQIKGLLELQQNLIRFKFSCTSAGSPEDPQGQTASVLQTLLESLDRWIPTLTSEHVEPTTRIGIASRAFDSLFVPHLTAKLLEAVKRANISMETIMEIAHCVKPINKCAFGDVVACVRVACEQSGAIGVALGKEALDLLNTMPAIRNALVKRKDSTPPRPEELIPALESIRQLLAKAPEFFGGKGTLPIDGQ